jgi:hypothetical protein
VGTRYFITHEWGSSPSVDVRGYRGLIIYSAQWSSGFKNRRVIERRCYIVRRLDSVWEFDVFPEWAVVERNLWGWWWGWEVMEDNVSSDFESAAVVLSVCDPD